MKRMMAGLAAGLLVAALCGCGGTANRASEDASATDNATELSTLYEFAYAKKELPEGWTVLEKYGTTSYLEAVYGESEDENAPTLSVSVYHYDDSHGYGKAKALAEAVYAREKKSSKIQTRTINGTEFQFLSFPSPNNEKLLRYEFYGQTEPDENLNYDFFMVVLDKLTDEKQFAALQEVLDCIDFSTR